MVQKVKILLIHIYLANQTIQRRSWLFRVVLLHPSIIDECYDPSICCIHPSTTKDVKVNINKRKRKRKEDK